MNRKLHASKKNERHLTRHGIFDASHFLSIPSVPYRMTKNLKSWTWCQQCRPHEPARVAIGPFPAHPWEYFWADLGRKRRLKTRWRARRVSFLAPPPSDRATAWAANRDLSICWLSPRQDQTNSNFTGTLKRATKILTVDCILFKYISFLSKNHCIRSLWIKKSVPDLVFHVKIFLVESRWDGISICRTEMVREWVVFCGLIFGKRSFLQLLQIILEVVFCHVAQFRRRDGRGGFRVPNWPTGIVQHGFKWATTYNSDFH